VKRNEMAALAAYAAREGGVYEAPLDGCDCERDYEVARAHFEKRFGATASSSQDSK
jgi:hypothetical protein